jgi:hypothetical protein
MDSHSTRDSPNLDRFVRRGLTGNIHSLCGMQRKFCLSSKLTKIYYYAYTSLAYGSLKFQRETTEATDVIFAENWDSQSKF